MAIFSQYRRVALIVCVSTLTACGWVDDTGRQTNTKPAIALDDVNQYAEASQVQWSFRDFDEDGNLSSIRFELAASGSTVSSCSGFPDLAVAATLRDACQPHLSDAECEVVFNIGESDVNVSVPELRRPAALRYNIHVIDEDGAAASRSIDMCIASESELPVAADDEYAVTYLQQLSPTGSRFDEDCVNLGGTGVLQNDTDDFDYSEGWPSGQACLRAELVESPVYAAEFELNADGSFRYLSSGAAGPGSKDSFKYKLSDGRNESEIALVNILITGDNEPPLALNPTLSTDEDQALSISLAQLASDPENTELILESFTQPANGTLQKVDTGLRFIPADNFSGSTSFKAVLTDASSLPVESLVNITVNEVNDTPVLSELPVRFAIDGSSQQSSGYSWTFTIGDEETALADLRLTVEVGDSIAEAQLEGPNANGQVTVSFEPLRDGSSSAVFSLLDTPVGSLGARTTEISIPLSVTGMNLAPIAKADAADMFKNTELDVAVLANDSDPDGEPSSLRIGGIVEQPNNGSASIVGSGQQLRYVPQKGFSGTDQVRYQVVDAEGGSAEAVLTLSVINRAPVVVDETARMFSGAVAQFAVLLNDSDPDGDELAVYIVDNDFAGRASVADNVIRYVSTLSSSQTVLIPYEVRDGDGGVATGTVTVFVENNDSGR